MSSVKSNFLWNATYQIIRIIIPIIITPYLTRVLGSEQLGVYNYTNTIAAYATLFIILGLNQYGSRTIAKTKHNKELMTKNFWSMYAMQLVMGVAVCMLYTVYLMALEGSIAVCSWVWLIYIVSEIFDFGWLFYGLEEFRVITIRNVIVRLLSVIAIFAFIHNQNDVAIYCLISALAMLLNSLIFVAMLPSRISGLYVPRPKEVLAHVKPNLMLFAPMIAISLYTQLNSVLLGLMATMSEVAFYANSYSIVTIPLALISSLSTVLLPRLSAVLQQDDEQTALRYISTSMWISLFMCFGLLAGIIGVADLFVPTYYGPGYEPCIAVLPILSAMIIPCSISAVTGGQYLLPHEKDALFLRSVLIGAAANVVLCFIAIPIWGAIGAAVVTVAVEFIVAICQIVCIRSALPFGEYLRNTLPFIAAAVIEWGVIRLISCLALPDIPLLCLEILGGIVSYCLTSTIILLFKKDQTFIDLIKG